MQCSRIFTIFGDGREVFTVKRDHNGHAACLQDEESLRFRNKLKMGARVAPENSPREKYDEATVSVISQVLG